jgi:hypothetical protein
VERNCWNPPGEPGYIGQAFREQDKQEGQLRPGNFAWFDPLVVFFQQID